MPDPESQIRLRAYLIWEAENRPEGKHLEHWWRAKTEVEGGTAAKPQDVDPGASSSGVKPAGTEAREPLTQRA